MRFIKTGQTAINSLVADQIINGALADTKWLMLRNKGEARIKDIDLTGSTLFYYKYKSWKPGGKWEIHLDSAKGPLLKNITVENSKGDWKIATTAIPTTIGKHHLIFTYNNRQINNPDENGIQYDWFRLDNPFPKNGTPEGELAYNNFDSLLHSNNYTPTPIMLDNPGTPLQTAGRQRNIPRHHHIPGPRPLGNPLVRLIRPVGHKDRLNQRVGRGPDAPVGYQNHRDPQARCHPLGLGLHRAGIGVDIKGHANSALAWK
jgi:hypothetical protein